MLDVFNGLFDFDAKFWKTIIPLLINPGKVSKDYVEGKRQRYSNPFRFYLTVSIIFFLIIGLSKTIEKYEALASETITESKDLKEGESVDIDNKSMIPTDKELDSIKEQLDRTLKKSFVPSIARKKILQEVEKEVKDTMNTKNNDFNFGNTRLDKFTTYVKENPNLNIDSALDSLGFQKTFTNRFLLTRAKTLYAIAENDQSKEQFLGQALSYGSVALFLLLPFFTLFLRFFYIRRQFTYIDHLIFVFHVQTVFFMLFSVAVILKLFNLTTDIKIFTGLFLLYLFLAMKKFYQQGYVKTFFKFLLLNFCYMLFASIGVVLVFLVSFALF